MDQTRIKKPKGIKPRDNAIQIYFKLAGESEYCYETLPWHPTPVNLIKAGKLRAEIVEKIKHGVFNYADYFPDSPRATHETGTFYDFAQAWLDDPSHTWTESSRDKFRGILQRVWMPSLDNRAARLITPNDINKALADAFKQFVEQRGKEPSKSLFNDWLLCVRGVFDTAVVTGALKRLENPTQHLKNKKRNVTDIDPFLIDDANRIIADIYKSYGNIIGAWFELGFYSGMRYPSEPSALTWNDVDMQQGEVRISKITTKAGIQNTTKTGKSRILYLNMRSRQALELLRAEPHTNTTPLFVNAAGGDFRNAKRVRRIWAETLQKLEIRYRDMYNMRHTYATFGLMNGVNPAFMASQLGHSIEEFFKTYAKWINSNQNEREMKLIEMAIKLACDSGQKLGE